VGVIVPIVEGDGEDLAVPRLLARVIWGPLRERAAGLPHTVGDAICAHGETKLLKEGRLERFHERALMRRNCVGVFVIFDADGGCAEERALHAARRLRKRNAPVPAAVVVARRMYESWFLANLAGNGDRIRDILGLAADARPDRAPEEVPNPKTWLTEHMPRGRPYKQTTHQEALTQAMDLAIPCEHSRSFQRLLHAVEELLEAIREGRADVTPKPPCAAVQDPT